MPWASTLDTETMWTEEYSGHRLCGDKKPQSPTFCWHWLTNFISSSQPSFPSANGGGNFLLHLLWKTRVNHNVSQSRGTASEGGLCISGSKCSWVRGSLRQREGRWGNRISRHWERQDECCLAEFSLSSHSTELSWQLGFQPAPTPSALTGCLGTGNFK